MILVSTSLRQSGIKNVHYVVLLLLTIKECLGHLVLTYPPSRKYPLDFLNNKLTTAPCGMPKNPEHAHYTDLPAASSVQVFWDIAYPHRGGVFIEIWNSSNAVVQRYPQAGYMLAADVSQLNYTIQLPELPCSNCTIRMVKGAQEWGENYLFWSCSDVNLVTASLNDHQRCSSHGLYDGSQCICDRKYEGTQCQFENDCLNASDCNSHGQCIDTQSSRYPKMQCFCSPGWFGQFCEKESKVKDWSEINLSLYQQRNLSVDYTIFHRILLGSKELEVVLVARSVTWIALGWRPHGVNRTCQRFPILGSIKERNASNGETKPPGKTEPTSEPQLMVNTCDGSCGPSSNCLYNVTWTHDPRTQRVNFTITVQLGRDEYFGLGFSKDQLMFDSDIVVGWVRRDGTTYLSDRWASTYQLPDADTQNDLELISGQTNNGMTMVSFSRALNTRDSSDLALNVSECIYLLTSQGPHNGDDNFTHHSQRMPSSSKFCFTNCPVEATIDPAGAIKPTRQPDQSEQITIENPQPMTNPCDGSCISDCLFNVTWTHDPQTQKINFTVTVQLAREEYFGLGFSKNQRMPDSDIVIGWVRRDGTTYLSDRWASAYQLPDADTQNDLELISGQTNNGMTVLSFLRALDTRDSKDLALNVSECIYLLTSQGPKNDDNFFYHSQRMPSSSKFCFTNCPVEATIDPAGAIKPTRQPDQSEQITIENPQPMTNPCDGSCISDCLFNVTWTHDPQTQKINFTVTVQLAREEYFGLGFSKNQRMPDSDIVVGWVRRDGTTYLSDRWASAYQLPIADTQNDLELISGQINNGVTVVSFSRTLDTRDSSDLALNVSECIYLLTSQGPKNDDNNFFYHSKRMPSSNKFCFTNCPVKTTTDPSGEIKPTGKSESHAEESLHPMDCIDVIVGAARGNYSRIGDYYTRDQSTPLPDEVYDGIDSLTAALGVEEGEFTTILFRRKLESSDPADWSLPNELMHVVWAVGQQETDIYHNPDSAFEANEMFNRNFYKNDVLKYHGTHRNHRGTTAFNFYDNLQSAADCSSGGCVDITSCPYILTWTYNPEDDTVTFQINATVSYNQWVALGIASNSQASSMDIIAVYFEQDSSGDYSVPVLSDRYTTDRAPGEADRTNNVQLLSGRHENGVSSFVFKRRSFTGDSQDVDLRDLENECPYVVYQIGGLVIGQDTLTYPEQEYPIRAERVCFGVCMSETTTAATITGKETSSSGNKTTSTPRVTAPSSDNATTFAPSTTTTTSSDNTTISSLIDAVTESSVNTTISSLIDAVTESSDNTTISSLIDAFTESSDNTTISSLIDAVTESSVNTTISSLIDAVTESSDSTATSSLIDAVTESLDSTATSSLIDAVTESSVNTTISSLIDAVTESSVNTTISSLIDAVTESSDSTATSSLIDAVTESSVNTATSSLIDAFTESSDSTATSSLIDAFTESSVNTTISSLIDAFTESSDSTATSSLIDSVTESSVNTTISSLIDAFTESSDSTATSSLIDAFTESSVNTTISSLIDAFTESSDSTATSSLIDSVTTSSVLRTTTTSTVNFAISPLYDNTTLAAPATSYLNATTTSVATTTISFPTTVTTTTIHPVTTASSSPESTAASSTSTISPETTTTGKTTTDQTSLVLVVVPAAVKIVSHNYSEEYANLNSALSQETKRTVENELDRILQERIQFFDTVTVTGFSAGSVIADMDIKVQAKEADTVVVKKNVESIMMKVLEAGSLGGLKLDQNFLVFAQPRIEPVSKKDNSRNYLGNAEIIIIVVSVALCVVAICVLLYKVWSSRRNKSTENDRRGASTTNDSQNGNVACQAYAEFQEYSRASKKAPTQGHKHEPHNQMMYDNPGYGGSQAGYQTTYIA